MATVEHKTKSVKFPDLARANTFYVERTALPELQVWQLADRPQTNLTGFKTNLASSKDRPDFFHRSQVTAVPLLYRQTKRYFKTPKNSRESYLSSKKRDAAKHSKVIQGVLPELSTNQCKFFSKWSKEQDPLYTAAGRPNTNLTTCYQQAKNTPDVKPATDKNGENLNQTKESVGFRLPNVQSPTPSTKKGYIMKWLTADFNKSPYYDGNDGRSSRSRSREMMHSNKIVFNSPFVDDEHLPSPLRINNKIS